MTDQEIDDIAKPFSSFCVASGSREFDHVGFARALLSRAIPEGHVVVPGWLPKSDGLPTEGMYLVHSSYGIHCAYRHDPEWADCFQDVGSQCDEGMQDDYGKLFEVYAWMPLPAAPANKEGA